MSNMKSEIADITLKDEGALLYDWAAGKMTVLSQIAERFRKEGTLKGIKIAACLHITSETANLVMTLRAGGAEVFLCASNPLSTKDAITAYLVDQGVHVYAIHGEDRNVYFSHCQRVLDAEPHIVIDDGGDLTRLLHADRRESARNVIGGLEETTTGVIRIRALEREGRLAYPIVAINDAKTKHMFDNRYGTGQSTVDAIMRSTNILLAGQKFVVSGFGMCGRGVSMRARGLGADVIVTEVNPVRALEAVMEGYRVMTMSEAAREGDVFVTVTGNKHVIRREHFEVMKDGAIVANAGHFDVEIDLVSLNDISARKGRLRANIEEYTLKSGSKIVVLGEGRLVNLVAAEGHPASVMDMSFACQSLACEYLVKSGKKLPRQVVLLPNEMDEEIARLKLRAMGVAIDSLSQTQTKYLGSWEEGT